MAIAPLDQSPPVTVALPGAVITVMEGRAELELDASTTDEQFSDALALLPPRAELVATEYLGVERMIFEW